ncbi:MAG: hypothetical protein KAR40_11265 [Candidatus Sabulitectum sp.]|nr:hypothetical protein [Candidatus Sabulitectum sp.]
MSVQTRKPTHKCDVCGKIDFFTSDWSRYSSIMHDETCPDEMPEACSEACKAILMAKLDSGEWKIPLLSRIHAYGCDVKTPRKGY